jgi:hypothetical protein
MPGAKLQSEATQKCITPPGRSTVTLGASDRRPTDTRPTVDSQCNDARHLMLLALQPFKREDLSHESGCHKELATTISLTMRRTQCMSLSHDHRRVAQRYISQDPYGYSDRPKVSILSFTATSILSLSLSVIRLAGKVSSWHLAISHGRSLAASGGASLNLNFVSRLVQSH